MEKQVHITFPEPNQKVRTIFCVSGWIPKDCMEDVGVKPNVPVEFPVEFIDLKGRAFLGVGIDIQRPKKNWLSKFRKKYHFIKVFNLTRFVETLRESQGRIAMRINGSIFIPIVIKEFASKRPSPEILKKHQEIGRMVLECERRWKYYAQEFVEIVERREKKIGIPEYEGLDYRYVEDLALQLDILNILSGDGQNWENPCAEEDAQLQQLEVKYADVIEVMGPMLGKEVLPSFFGFHAIIYSKDHGKHLHIIHSGRDVDVRISFPEIQIDSYKSGALSSREIKKISELLKRPENFSKLEAEFQRRDG